jgi:hypothetical protein
LKEIDLSNLGLILLSLDVFDHLFAKAGLESISIAVSENPFVTSTDLFDGILSASHHLGQPADNFFPDDLPHAVKVPIEYRNEVGLLEVFLETFGRPDLRGEDVDQPELVETRLSEQEGKGFDCLRGRRREVELDEVGKEGESDLCSRPTVELTVIINVYSRRVSVILAADLPSLTTASLHRLERHFPETRPSVTKHAVA